MREVVLWEVRLWTAVGTVEPREAWVGRRGSGGDGCGDGGGYGRGKGIVLALGEILAGRLRPRNAGLAWVYEIYGGEALAQALRRRLKNVRDCVCSLSALEMVELVFVVLCIPRLV